MVNMIVCSEALNRERNLARHRARVVGRSNDEKLAPVASWFEMHGVAVLLTVKISDLILRSIANGSRECAPR